MMISISETNSNHQNDQDNRKSRAARLHTFHRDQSKTSKEWWLETALEMYLENVHG